MSVYEKDPSSAAFCPHILQGGIVWISSARHGQSSTFVLCVLGHKSATEHLLPRDVFQVSVSLLGL